MRHTVRRWLNPSGYRFGYLAMAIAATYLWIVTCTALLDAFGQRQGPSQYMRWVPDNAGHLMTAPTSFALRRGLAAATAYLQGRGPMEALVHSAFPGAGLILAGGLIQTVLLYLLLRGGRLRTAAAEAPHPRDLDIRNAVAPHDVSTPAGGRGQGRVDV